MQNHLLMRITVLVEFRALYRRRLIKNSSQQGRMIDDDMPQRYNQICDSTDSIERVRAGHLWLNTYFA